MSIKFSELLIFYEIFANISRFIMSIKNLLYKMVSLPIENPFGKLIYLLLFYKLLQCLIFSSYVLK